MENNPVETSESKVPAKVEISPLKCKTTENTRKLDGKYNLTSLPVGEFFTIGMRDWNPARGEIAARILVACQNNSRFAAISYWDISQQIDQETEDRKELDKKYQTEWEKRSSLMGIIRGILSGVFGKTQKTEPDSEKELREAKLIFSALARESEESPYVLNREVSSMQEEGLINILQEGKEQYLEPTEKLIAQILEAQKKSK